MRHLALGCGALTLSVAAACVVPDDLHTVEQSIIGGQSAQITEFPSLALIENGPGQWFCAGILIDKDWVLTTAGCLLGESPTSIRLRFDDNNVNDGNGGKIVQIAALQRHPNFNQDFPNDIALIKLAQSVTDRAPTPILRSAIAVSTMTTQAGWGDNGNGDGVLRKLTTPTDNCDDIGFANSDFLCFNATDGNATCYGDGGGPAFVTANGKTYVGGVAAGGTNDQCTQGYSVFTSVPSKLAFIDQFVPKVEDPTNPDPTDPMNPDPTDPGDPSNPERDPDAGKNFNSSGCSTSGSGGGWLLSIAAIVGALLLRRRRGR